jgi:hypothetical protein
MSKLLTMEIDDSVPPPYVSGRQTDDYTPVISPAAERRSRVPLTVWCMLLCCIILAASIILITYGTLHDKHEWEEFKKDKAAKVQADLDTLRPSFQVCMCTLLPDGRRTQLDCPDRSFVFRHYSIAHGTEESQPCLFNDKLEVEFEWNPTRGSLSQWESDYKSQRKEGGYDFGMGYESADSRNITKKYALMVIVGIPFFIVSCLASCILLCASLCNDNI